MRKYKTSLVLTGYAALLGLIGCANKGVNSSVDSNTAGRDLSQEEVEEVCRAGEKYLDDQLPAADLCRIDGLWAYAAALRQSDAVDPVAACDEVVTECLSDSEDGTGEYCDDIEPFGETCEATVGEIEDCLTENTDSARKALDASTVPDCDGMEEYIATLSEEEVEDAYDFEPELSAACEKIFDDCF